MAQPITVSKYDTITDNTALEIIKANCRGEELCGWPKSGLCGK